MRINKGFGVLVFVVFFLPIFAAHGQPIGAVRFLSHYIPPMGGSWISGCWGWTDSVSGREYAVLGSFCGTSIVEITNASVPVERAFIPGVCSIWREIQVYSHYAYVVSEGGGGTQIIDLSFLPDSAHLVKNFTYTQSGKNTTYSHTLHIKDGYMYLNGCAQWSPGGIVIFSLADPVNPAFQSEYEQRYVHDCFVRNDTIYAATINNGGIDIIDVRIKTSPQFLYRFTYPGAGTHNCATTTDGKYLLTTDEIGSTPKTLKFWNLQTPPSFPNVAEYVGSPTAIVHNVFVKGTLAIMSYYTAGLRVVDISDPTHPAEIGGYDTYSGGDPAAYDGAWSAYPFFPSGKIIIGDEDTGLYIVDLDYNAPNNPQSFTAYSDYATPTSVKLTWNDPTALVSGAPLSNFKLHIFRNGSFIAVVDSGTQMYVDAGLSKHQYYMYTLRAAVSADSSSGTSAGANAGGSAIPQAPSSFNTIDATDGILLTWQNPTRQFDNTPLNDLAQVFVYRDNVFIKAINQSSADTGQNRSYLDTVIGYHSYAILVSDNEAPTNYSSLTPSITGYGGILSNYAEGFESSLATIYHTGSWDTTSSASNAGIHAYTDSPVGNYADNSTSYFQTPPVILGSTPILQFSHIAIIASADFAFVEISKNARNTFTVLKVYNMTMHPEWQDSYADPADWFTDVFNLSAYAGDTVVVRFRLVTNGITNKDGWYIDDLVIGSPNTLTTDSYPVMSGWNMLSLPVVAPDGSESILYPFATSKAFSFNGSAYIQNDSLLPGNGYWIKFDSSETVQLTGATIRRDTLDVHAGWNIIGSISSRIPAAAIKSIPTGIVSSSFFAFNGSYDAATRIEAGQSYWVKTTQAGKLILSAYQNNVEPAAPPEKASEPISLNTLTITSNNGHSQTLLFTRTLDGSIDRERFELPPLPPEGAFDARFSNQQSIAASGKDGKNVFPIVVQGTQYPLTISWNVANSSSPWTLIVDEKKFLLSTSGSTLIPQPSPAGGGRASRIELAFSLSPSSDIPTEFALEQNYPNPFNPSTDFGLRIPASPAGESDIGFVTLKVYDVLGQEAATLIEKELEPGNFTATWNAGNAPSGVYYARMIVTGSSGKQLFQTTKKLVLMK